jgi:hypothetical protein
MRPDRWIADDLLDDELREALARFTTPRRGEDGGLVWPRNEVVGVLLPEPIPLEWEQELEAREAAVEQEDAAAACPPPSPDLIATEVARRQRARQAKRTTRRLGTPTTRSRWAHVPLAALFNEAGNPLHERGNGIVECGHEPVHGSKGGRYVSITPVTGLWWCRSCRQGGDAVSLVMALQGCSRQEAEAVLFLRFGAPSGPRRRERVITIELP